MTERRGEENKPAHKKSTSPNEIKQVITSYFCSPRLYIFPDNYELLRQNDFQLPIERVMRMAFIQYYNPTVDVIQRAFSRTQYIQTRGDFLYFNQAKEFVREEFHLGNYALLFGPFPKKFSALHLQRVISQGSQKPVMYSISIEKQFNSLLFAIFANPPLKDDVRSLKEPKPKEFLWSDEFEDASKHMRTILKSGQPISNKDVIVAWKNIYCFDCDAEIVDWALSAIQKRKK